MAKALPFPTTREEREANLAANLARAEQMTRLGLHGRSMKVCDRCGQWCDGYYHHTQDGKWICKACYLGTTGK